MGKQPINIIDRNFYTKFKREHDRICRKLKKDSISQEDYDNYNNLVCRKVLRRELGETYNQILKKAGCKVNKRTFTKEESEELNKNILKLRLDGLSYREVSEMLDVSMMTIQRRVDKIYRNSDKKTKNRLDYVKSCNINKWHIKENNK